MVAGAQSSTSSYARIPTLFALTFLATFSFFAIFTSNLGHNDLMPHHQRRSIMPRQDSSSSSQTAARISSDSATPGPTFSTSSISTSTSSSQSSHSTTVTPPPPRVTTSTTSSSRSSSSASSSTTSSSSSSQSTPSSLSSSLSSSTLPSITSTTSVVVPTTNSPLNIVPVTTLMMTDSLRLPTRAPTPTIQTQPTDTPSSLPVGAASTSSAFWNNKAAVVATFIVVAVAICGTIGLGLLYFLKKRNAKMERELHEELFEKHTDPHRSMSPISSINGAPIDPFASDNDLRVRHNQQSSVDSNHSSQRGYHSTQPIQHPDFYDRSAPFSDYVVTSTYLPPSRAAEAARQGPPSAFRNPATQNVRASYQPSLDSFYGGIAQGPSTGYPRP
ncbi:hypothetical protein BJ165DRAFT_1425033 [Panaeolus papilionaceus]|nr:hypothetical protein BJ165DRAFT_1425033 [Panaeolus papilionaceus]